MTGIEFERYLGMLGRLYREGIEAGLAPATLRRMGGALALAGRDAVLTRARTPAFAALSHMHRPRADLALLARKQWRRHRARIMDAILRGLPPLAAVREYFHSRTGSRPQSPGRALAMLRQAPCGCGACSAWVAPIHRKECERRRSALLTAVVAGDAFVQADNMAAGVAPGPRASAASRRRAAARPQKGKPGTADDLNLDVAFDPGRGAWQRGPMEGVDRQGRRLVDTGTTTTRLDYRSRGQRIRPARTIPSLDSLGLTAAQTAAARSLVGQALNPAFRACWRAAIGDQARRDQDRVRSLEQSGDSEQLRQARVLARAVFDRIRGRFWCRVLRNHELRTLLDQARLRLPPVGRRQESGCWAPSYQLGRRIEHLTLEHDARVADLPSASIDGNRMLFSLRRENSGMLEGLREAPYERARLGAKRSAPPRR